MDHLRYVKCVKRNTNFNQMNLKMTVRFSILFSILFAS